MGRVAFVITTELSGLEKGRSLRGAERRSNPDVEGRLTFPLIASLTLAMTKLVRDDATKQRTVRRAIELDSAPLRRLWRQCLTWAWTQISSESALSSALSRCD